MTLFRNYYNLKLVFLIMIIILLVPASIGCVTSISRESITNNHENEKVNEIDARKKITIKINDPTTPKTLERLVKTKAPTKPPDEDWGKRSPE